MEILAQLGQLPISVALAVILVFLYLNLVKRSDKKDENHEKRDEAFILTMSKINLSLDENLRLTRGESEKSAQRDAELSEKIAEISKVLDNINCLKK